MKKIEREKSKKNPVTKLTLSVLWDFCKKKMNLDHEFEYVFLINMQNGEREERKDMSGDNTSEKDEKKQRTDSRGKQMVKQAKDNSDTKDDYVHMRAKRGQATNSHSLAERVRFL